MTAKTLEQSQLARSPKSYEAACLLLIKANSSFPARWNRELKKNEENVSWKEKQYFWNSE